MRWRSRFRRERRSHRPWRNAAPPGRVLLIRLHALGDVALVLPAASAISRAWAGARVDMLTAPPSDAIARTLPSLGNVFVLPAAGGRTMRVLHAIRHGLALRKLKYDVIIDFQRNYVTRIIRRVSGPSAWSEFDRFSPLSASRRVIDTVAACGLRDPAHDIPVPQSAAALLAARNRLLDAGWDGSRRLVAFNPAGLWPTRNWPLENYVELYRLWQAREPLTVVIIGTERVRSRGEEIARRGGRGVINLAAQTGAGEAFALLRHTDVIITEDSGLMHMAWSAGVPVVALFGSTNSVWSSPAGDRAVCLDSSDLDCGQCMAPACRFGDVRCLTRRTPAEVLAAAADLLARCRVPHPGAHA